jgi:hypothetical protein
VEDRANARRGVTQSAEDIAQRLKKMRDSPRAGRSSDNPIEKTKREIDGARVKLQSPSAPTSESILHDEVAVSTTDNSIGEDMASSQNPLSSSSDLSPSMATKSGVDVSIPPQVVISSMSEVIVTKDEIQKSGEVFPTDDVIMSALTETSPSRDPPSSSKELPPRMAPESAIPQQRKLPSRPVELHVASDESVGGIVEKQSSHRPFHLSRRMVVTGSALAGAAIIVASVGQAALAMIIHFLAHLVFLR